jgi:hypothetical protein
MALPTIHTFTHVPVMILPNDSAWNMDKVLPELRSLELAHGLTKPEEGEEVPDPASLPWPSLADHPWNRYWTGASRYDLRTVVEYIEPGGDPVKFVLRKLVDKDWDRANGMFRRGEDEAALRFSVSRGLMEVEGPVRFRIGKPGVLTDSETESVRVTFGDAAFRSIGSAVFVASAMVTEPEKKR